MKNILEDPGFQQTLKDLAKENRESLETVKEQAEVYLKELFTEHQPLPNAIWTQTTEYLLSRGYSKSFDVNQAELKKVAQIMRRHPVAFVTTHKSYIDTVVLTLALARQGLPLPYTFGGINLSFMGMGFFARKIGVIFIRRTFKDNYVYKATLRHLIATLVRQKQHFVWAIEGTRSRTGKLMWPKMGILKYITNAEQDTNIDVKYIPVSIVYDLIPDVKEMTAEGRGKIKKPESLSWFANYLKKMGDSFGRISIRFGDPVKLKDEHVTLPGNEINEIPYKNKIPRFAIQLVQQINHITPVTTASLICIALLSKFALTKKNTESDVVDLMELIENHKPDAMVDRGKPIGESVQVALNLLAQANLIRNLGEGLHSKYMIAKENYLSAIYYVNMTAHHFFHRAFIELAMLKISETAAKDRTLAFWTEVMALRDLFKFEFFYSDKPAFCDKIERELITIDNKWQKNILSSKKDLVKMLHDEEILLAPVILHTYVEASRVVAQGLLEWDNEQIFDDKKFLDNCLVLGEEMQWQGRIQHIESVSKPFLLNAISLCKNKGFIPEFEQTKEKEIQDFINQLDELASRINTIKGITLSKHKETSAIVPLERKIVPGSKTANITKELADSENGPHIGAFFDLDRTLIDGFSAKEFFTTHLLSGRMTAKEVVAQCAGILVYAVGNRNFAGLAAIGTNGVKGVKEQVFIEVGEEVYLKHLTNTIYPESRALVDAHLAKGHTVAIVSAATPYQVDAIARDLGIEHVMCTRMEVIDGRFTGKIIEPACWGEGKAYAGRQLAEKHNLDLSKSYFYTDSFEDLPLLEIVGHPRPINPDTDLAAHAFQYDWPVARFDDGNYGGISNIIRTGLTMGSLFPAALTGVASGAFNLSWKDGINSMMATIGDLGTKMAGIKLVVKGQENLWSDRPAVFIFNHQSNADFFIGAKLVRKNATAVAKKELASIPIFGQMLKAGGVIFLDRKNRDKAIEAMKPAVDILKSGVSVIIAPEGTRSKDYNLGAFKKGPFHLAMQAGVPIVPIVIMNAHDVMPKGVPILKPTAVEVVVLPPIPTTGWKVEDINQHIADVRNLFLKQLGQEEIKLLQSPNGQH